MAIRLPRFLNLARVISFHSTYHIRIGAVIVRHGHPIAVGWNEICSHPRLVKFPQATIHAEISALVTVPKTNLHNATIFVYRECDDEYLSMARPCTNCWTMLKARGVKWIVYTTSTYPYWQKERIC